MVLVDISILHLHFICFYPLFVFNPYLCLPLICFIYPRFRDQPPPEDTMMPPPPPPPKSAPQPENNVDNETKDNEEDQEDDKVGR